MSAPSRTRRPTLLAASLVGVGVVVAGCSATTEPAPSTSSVTPSSAGASSPATLSSPVVDCPASFVTAYQTAFRSADGYRITQVDLDALAATAVPVDLLDPAQSVCVLDVYSPKVDGSALIIVALNGPTDLPADIATELTGAGWTSLGTSQDNAETTQYSAPAPSDTEVSVVLPNPQEAGALGLGDASTVVGLIVGKTGYGTAF